MAETARLTFQIVDNGAVTREFSVTREVDGTAYVVDYGDKPLVRIDGDRADRIYDCCEAMLFVVVAALRKEGCDG